MKTDATEALTAPTEQRHFLPNKNLERYGEREIWQLSTLADIVSPQKVFEVVVCCKGFGVRRFQARHMFVSFILIMSMFELFLTVPCPCLEHIGNFNQDLKPYKQLSCKQAS